MTTNIKVKYTDVNGNVSDHLPDHFDVFLSRDTATLFRRIISGDLQSKAGASIFWLNYGVRMKMITPRNSRMALLRIMITSRREL